MGIWGFVEQLNPSITSTRIESRNFAPTISDYNTFRDSVLTDMETDYLNASRESGLRVELMRRWGIRSLSQLKLIQHFRYEDVGTDSIKMVNEMIYDVGGGMLVCHSWRGEDNTCGWKQGDMEIIKFSQQVMGLYEGWLERVQ